MAFLAFAAVAIQGTGGLKDNHTSAICDFLRREDELMTELMNHKRSTS
jgi:hypothetical protein